MRSFLACLATFALMGCPGDEPAPVVDAPASSIDAPAGNVCTGAVYDPCTMASQCLSGNCREFTQQGIQICTQSCDANNPCPPQNGVAIQCNGMNLCRGQAANNCTR